MGEINVIINPAPSTQVIVKPNISTVAELTPTNNISATISPIIENVIVSTNGGVNSSFFFSITGSPNQSSINIEGQSGIQTILSGKNLIIDGSQIIATIQSTNSGNIAYTYTLNSGINIQTVSFPQSLTYIPIISCILINNIDNLLYGYFINSVTTSGFNVLFSDTLVSSGYQLGITLSL
jgi:hypothetical protein